MSLLLFAQCRRASALGKEFDQLSTGSVSLWDGLHCPVVEHAVVDLEPGSGTDGAGVEMQQECVREQYVARADENAQCRNTGKIGMFRAQLGVIEGAIRRVPPPCLLQTCKTQLGIMRFNDLRQLVVDGHVQPGREQRYAGRLRLATVPKFLRDAQ
ncbi:Uncharacterised protein [Mycobacteroides abscessus subsp. abscessus]|nr:Uncharacterised protein [Mycobacteroides abscessus subsp. abscessus]